jgi:hypothetical protein
VFIKDMSEQENESASDFGGVFWAIIILAICLAAWFSLPNFIDTFHVGSHGSPANACINNLRQIDAAENQFALEHHLTNGDAINFPNDLTPYIKLNSAGKIPGCPQGGIYHIGKVGETPTCSLSNAVPPHVLP